jgi:hypothetical protein
MPIGNRTTGSIGSWRRVIFFVVAVTSMASLVSAAPQDATYSLYGDPAVPDISGTWLGTVAVAPGEHTQTPVDERNKTTWAPWPAPLTPEYQKKTDERIAAAKAGRQLGDIGAKCLPFGVPRMLTSKFYQDEIIQTPGRVSLFVFGTFPIIVWTDGRPHPKDLQPTYNGHSIGRWVDDTLFVDTVGILSSTPVNNAGQTTHSDKLHIKWNIQRVAPDVLHVQVTLYDDEAFTEPMVTTGLWHRKGGPNWQMLDDQSCFENNQNVPNSGVAEGFKKF